MVPSLGGDPLNTRVNGNSIAALAGMPMPAMTAAKIHLHMVAKTCIQNLFFSSNYANVIRSCEELRVTLSRHSLRFRHAPERFRTLPESLNGHRRITLPKRHSRLTRSIE